MIKRICDICGKPSWEEDISVCTGWKMSTEEIKEWAKKK